MAGMLEKKESVGFLCLESDFKSDVSGQVILKAAFLNLALPR